MSQSPTIVWLLQGTEGFGVARAVQSLTHELRSRGYRTVWACFHEGQMAERGGALGVQVVQLGVGQAPNLAGGVAQKALGVLRLRRFRRRVAEAAASALANLDVRVVQCLWPSFVGITAEVASRLEAKPVWEMPNTISDALWGMNQRYYLGFCRKYKMIVLANSDYTARSLGEASGVKLSVMHLGADPTVFDPERVTPISRNELGIPDRDDAVVFGIIARLDPSKGADRFLRAMLRLNDEMHLLLVGGPADGEYAVELRRIVAQVGALDRLHIVGNVDDPERYYAAMDVAVNCRVDAEPFGLSVIEAMMMGKPVLVHALGGPAETVIHNQTGWHIHSPAIPAMEAGIRLAVEQRERWPAMGTAARARATSRYTVASQAERYLEAVGI